MQDAQNESRWQQKYKQNLEVRITLAQKGLVLVSLHDTG